MAELFMYVDNGMPTGHTNEDCWQESRIWVSVCTNMVIQDFLRKVENPSKEPRPWVYNVTHTDKGVLGMVSQKKWENNQRLIK